MSVDRIIIERAIGETRAAVFDAKTLLELHVRRDSHANMAHMGDIFEGRITSIDTDLSAAFVEMGSEDAGFLRFNMAPGAPRFREGMRVRVSVLREAEGSKGPILKYESEAQTDKTGRIEGLDLQGVLAQRFPDAVIEQGVTPDIVAASEPSFALNGGGVMTIEQTQALVAIDVDTDTAKSRVQASMTAAHEAARQLRLRGLGGLVVIDFPNLRKRKDRDQVWEVMEDALEADPAITKIAPYSRFGTIELTRQKTGPSLMDIVLGRDREPSVETQALEAIRTLLKTAEASPGGQLTLAAPAAVFAWLEKDTIGWHASVSGKIGARFNLITADRLSVTSDR